MTTPQNIERRIRTLQSRLPYCRDHGQDAQPIEDEIAQLKDALRASHGAAGAETRPGAGKETRA